MSVKEFRPQFMQVGVLTAALQELTPREVRDPDPDRAIEEWLEFASQLGVDNIQLSAALHPTESDAPAAALLAPAKKRWVRVADQPRDEKHTARARAPPDGAGRAGRGTARPRCQHARFA